MNKGFTFRSGPVKKKVNSYTSFWDNSSDNYNVDEFIDEFITIKEVDYYFSNSIARSSKTMSDCRAARSKKLNKITGS